MDGNKACYLVSYKFTEVAGIYPITPASSMAENIDQMSKTSRPRSYLLKSNLVPQAWEQRTSFSRAPEVTEIGHHVFKEVFSVEYIFFSCHFLIFPKCIVCGYRKIPASWVWVIN